MSPGIGAIDESAAEGGGLGAMVDEQALDAQPPVRQREHPFGAFCSRVLSELKLPQAQNAREVVSLVVGQVARLTVVDEDTKDEQAAHIGQMVSEDRKAQKDPQLWEKPATEIAQFVLSERIAGRAPVSDQAEAA